MNKAKILVVEEGRVTALDIEARLQSFGYRVVGVVGSGEEAIQATEQTRPDLVLMDVRLEGAMDGLEAAQEIRERFGTALVYILDSTDDETLGRAEMTTPFGYVVKPIGGRELRLTVEMALRNHRLEQELRESEEKYRNLVERANDGIVIIQDGVVKFANQILADMWGGSVDNIVGTPFTNYIHPEHVTELAKRYNQRMAGEEVPSIYETILKRRDGGDVYAELNAGLITYQGGPADLVIARDVTERERAEERQRRHNEQLEALQEVGLEVQGELNLNELLESIASQAVELVDARAGGFDLCLPKQGVLDFLIHTGYESLPRNREIQPGEGLAGKVWRTGESLIVDDYAAWEGRADGWADHLGHSANMGVPVQWGDEFLGVLEVTASPPRKFSRAEAELLEVFATQAAIAIKNARLFEETRRRATQVALLYEVGQQVSGELELDVLLSTIVSAVHDAFGFHSVILLLMDEDDKRLTMQSVAGAYVDILPSDLSLNVGEGMIGYAAATRETQLSGDVGTDPHYVRKAAEDTKSELSVPIKSGDRVIGVLDLQDDEFDAFDELDVTTLETLSTQIATAIENARLFEAERERSAQLATVSQVAEGITSILDLDQVLERTVGLISESFGYYHVGIMLVDEKANELVFGAHTGGYSGKIPPVFRQRLEEGIIGWSACHGETILANDVSQEPRYIPAFLVETRSELAVPLKYRDRVIGVLDLQSRELDAFDEHDVMAMEALAGHVATAIENARLYEQAQLEIKERRWAQEALRGRAEELAALQDTVLNITTRHDLPTLLETIVKRAASLLDAPSGGLYLCDRTRQEARCVVSYNTLHDYSDVILVYGEGAAGTVAQTGKPLIIDDYRIWPGRAGVFEEEQPFTAVLSAPMIWQEEVIGVVHVLDRAEERRFTETDLELLSLFANHAAIAVENARLLEIADQRVAELQTVRQASLHLTSTLELEPVLETILESALKLISADDAHVFLYNNDRLDFGAALWNGEHQHEPYDSIRPHGLTYTVARRGERVVVSDTMNHPIFADRRWEGAIASLPLTTGAEVQGVMNVAYQRPHRFSDDELRVLELLADQAAVAIRNARLYNETRERALEQETLREAALTLTTALDRDEVVERILAQLQRVVPYDTASVLLRREDCLDIVGGRGFEGLSEILGLSFPLDGNNPNREVIRTREPVILEDAPTMYDAFQLAPHARAGIRSWLGVPMLVGDKLIGMIALDKREPGFYGQEHARLAEAFAAQAAVAIENAQLHQETVRQLAQTEVLREMMLAAASTLDFGEVLDRTIAVLEEAMGIEYLGFMLPDESGGFMISHPSMLGFTPPEGGYRFPIDQCVTGRVYQTGEPAILSDIRQADVYATAAEDVRSVLAVPVKTGDKALAVLNLESSRLDAFTEADLAFYTAVAGQLGLAMENAQLFEAERQQRQLAEALEEAASAVSSTLELEQVLDRILEQVERVVAGDSFNIMLIQNERACVVRWRGYEKTGVEDRISTHSMVISEYPTLSKMLQTGRSMVVSDTAVAEGWIPQESWEWLRSYVAAPIQVGGTTVGFLNVDSMYPRQFSPDDGRRLETFASHAATAIENARLYERLRDHAETLGQRVAERTAQLQAQYARLEAILDSTVNGIVVAGPGGELVLANPVAREWLTQSLSPEEAQLLRRTLQDLANRAEENPEHVLELTGLDLQLKAAKIVEPGVEGATAVVAIHDISHLKALDRMKSRFVSSVSHELRTPIATIKLFAHLMQKQPEKWREYLEPLAQEADHQADLVEDILEISRVDAGRLEIRPERANLNELIEMVVVNHATRAGENGLTLENYAVGPGPVCSADPQRLIQILDNLIDNALRYTPKGGTVTISTGKAEAEGRVWATVTVADTGMGIPDDELPHVFERFFRGEKPRMMQISGTGLGLAIVKEIALLHGGYVTVESEVDKGSAFTVWLPLAP